MNLSELNILRSLQNIHAPWLDFIMTKITFLGDKGWFWIVVAIALCCFKKTRRMGLTAMIAMILGLIIGNGILKNLIARDRPYWLDEGLRQSLLVKELADYSCPSGHTQASFAAAVSIFLYNRKWGAAALALAVLIGFSRLYLGVHFPTDVLFGAALGTLFALFARPIARYAMKKLPKLLPASKSKSKKKAGRA